jgi:hypothetical protein
MHIEGKSIGKEIAPTWKELCQVLACIFFVAAKKERTREIHQKRTLKIR